MKKIKKTPDLRYWIALMIRASRCFMEHYFFSWKKLNKIKHANAKCTFDALNKHLVNGSHSFVFVWQDIVLVQALDLVRDGSTTKLVYVIGKLLRSYDPQLLWLLLLFCYPKTDTKDVNPKR